MRRAISMADMPKSLQMIQDTVGNRDAEQSLPPYGEPAARQLLTHLPRRGFPYGSPPVKRDVGAEE
jgi:hypothetical protein